MGPSTHFAIPLVLLVLCVILDGSYEQAGNVFADPKISERAKEFEGLFVRCVNRTVSSEVGTSSTAVALSSCIAQVSLRATEPVYPGDVFSNPRSKAGEIFAQCGNESRTLNSEQMNDLIDILKICMQLLRKKNPLIHLLASTNENNPSGDAEGKDAGVGSSNTSPIQYSSYGSNPIAGAGAGAGTRVETSYTSPLQYSSYGSNPIPGAGAGAGTRVETSYTSPIQYSSYGSNPIAGAGTRVETSYTSPIQYSSYGSNPIAGAGTRAGEGGGGDQGAGAGDGAGAESGLNFGAGSEAGAGSGVGAEAGIGAESGASFGFDYGSDLDLLYEAFFDKSAESRSASGTGVGLSTEAAYRSGEDAGVVYDSSSHYDADVK